MKMSAYIVIPAYQPNQTLIGLIGSLFEIVCKSTTINIKIIVVNDGSTNPRSIELFDRILVKFPDVIMLQHEKNLGKVQLGNRVFVYSGNCVESSYCCGRCRRAAFA